MLPTSFLFKRTSSQSFGQGRLTMAVRTALAANKRAAAQAKRPTRSKTRKKSVHAKTPLKQGPLQSLKVRIFVARAA
jgi:hypothetical protein